MEQPDKERHLPDGVILNNRYKIIRFLSAGGFGNTYEAEDIDEGSHVAVKELFISGTCKREEDSRNVSISVAENRELFRKQKLKFRKEAARLRQINHPGVVKVSDEFEENGTAYYVMDFVRGKSLEDMRDAGQLDEKKSVQYIKQVLSAIEAVHEKGILHMDIKPSNVMINENNKAIVIDFGASKQLETVDGKSLSLSTGIAYTPGYAPIEQMAGKRENIGIPADIYAIGATLYKLITGVTPPDPSELTTNGLPEVKASPEVQAAIKASVQNNYKARPQSVAEFRAILNGNATPEPKPNPNPNPKPKPNPGGTEIIDDNPSPRPRWLLPLLIALGVIVVGVLTFFLLNPFDPNDPKDSNDLKDSIVSNDTIVTPAAPVAPAVEVVDASVDDGYSVAYADALNLYNSRKYAECKSECRKLLRQYTSREQKQQLNQLIEYCDTALAAEEAAQQAAALEQQYQSDYTTAERLYNQKKYSECKSRCQSMLNSYPSHRGEINALISKCDSAISAQQAAEQAAASSRLPDKAVDLGLSVLWADRNVGASSSSGNGNYYTFDEAGSAARSMGSGWRLPTKAELEELDSKCSWSWTGSGYKVTGPNGNSIYLPAAGWRYGSSTNDVGSYGNYWSSTPYGSGTAYSLDFSSGSHGVSWYYRSTGFSVRPVRAK